MKKVSRADEFENVNGIIKLHQLLINLYNLEILLIRNNSRNTYLKWNSLSPICGSCAKLV